MSFSEDYKTNLITRRNLLFFMIAGVGVQIIAIIIDSLTVTIIGVSVVMVGLVLFLYYGRKLRNGQF